MPSLLEKYLQHLILSIWGFARWNFPLKWDTVCYRCVKGKGIKTMHWKTACQKLKENGGIFISSLYKDGLPRWGRQHFKWCLNCCKTHVAFQRANTNTSLPRFFERLPAQSLKTMDEKAREITHGVVLGPGFWRRGVCTESLLSELSPIPKTMMRQTSPKTGELVTTRPFVYGYSL